MPEINAQQKKKIKRVLDNNGSISLATLEAHIESIDKLEEVISSIKNIPQTKIPEGIETIKGQKGEKGDKGDLPSEEDLIPIIKRLIPDSIPGENGKDGKNGKDAYIPKKNKDYFDGKDGLDADEEYIISEITKLIPEYKEVILDNGEEIIRKINEAIGFKINASQIVGLPNFTREIIREVGAHGGAYETPIKGSATIIVSKDAFGAYVISLVAGAGGGANFETPVGTIDGTNVTFTVSNTPKAVILNGATYFQNDGYTLSGLTITMLVVPVAGSTLRSMY